MATKLFIARFNRYSASEVHLIPAGIELELFVEGMVARYELRGFTVEDIVSDDDQTIVWFDL